MLPGKPDITGVVLCGGKSSRMGQDKGLIITHETHWVKEAAAKLKFLNTETFFSVSETQFEKYAAVVEGDYLIADDEALDIAGPLKGLLSVHERFSGTDILLLACDMPLMKTEVLEFLYHQYLQNEYDAYVFGEPQCERTEPLVAIYRGKALAFIYQQLQSAKLKRYSMQYVLRLLCTKYNPIPKHWENAFLNVNSIKELKRLV